jgi:peptide/nickel transport system permease protein
VTSTSRSRPVWWLIRLVGRDLLLIASLVWLFIMLFLAITGSAFTPYDPTAVDLPHRLLPPMSLRDGNLYLAGTDQVGRDYLSRMIIGTRVSVGIGFASAGLATFSGLIAGSIAGYVGHATDMVIARIIDAWMSFPWLLLALLIVVSVGPSAAAVILVLTLAGWPGITRLARGLAFEIRRTAYVESAKAMGASTTHIVRRHVIPHLIAPVGVYGTLLIATNMLASAGLDFLGLGIQPPDTSWGLLVATGRDNIGGAPWLIALPGLAIFLTAFAVNLVAISLRRLLDLSGVNVRGLLRHQGPLAAADRSVALTATFPAGDLNDPPPHALGDIGSGVPLEPSQSHDEVLAGELAESHRFAPAPATAVGHERIEIPDERWAPILAVDHLSVDFNVAGTVAHAVRDVSWGVRRRETLAIVGESGSGKSATAKAIMGILEQSGAVTAGRILLEGENVLALPGWRRRRIFGRVVSLVQQDAIAALDPVMTIGAHFDETIRAHTENLSRQEVRRRALDLMARVEIPDPATRLRQYSFELSGGMTQRILIALAIANQPKVLIADEPTTALDVTTQAQIMDLLMDLRAANQMSLVLVTHDLALVAQRADRVVVMYGGIVMETGPVEEIIEHSGNPYTQALLRARPNVASGRVRLAQVPGTPPNASRLPSGCPFHPRCHLAIDRCRSIPAPAIELGPGHISVCHRAREAQST